MLTVAKTLLLILLVFPLGFVRDAIWPGSDAAPERAQGPEYTSDGQMRLPEHYREWVFLASGFDMSYSVGAQMPDHHMFDNVFVNPKAYEEFERTGMWPDKTVIVLEVRGAKGKGSINQRGNYQGPLMGIEVHVKDKALFPGGWAFFGFGDEKTAKKIPESADCYSCHAEHGAVDTTFVQFYPTVLETAIRRGTLAARYLKELAAPEAKEPL